MREKPSKHVNIREMMVVAERTALAIILRIPLSSNTVLVRTSKASSTALLPTADISLDTIVTLDSSAVAANGYVLPSKYTRLTWT